VEGFWTEAEAAFRRSAAEYFRRHDDPERSTAAAGPAEIWRALEGAQVPGATALPSRARLIGRVSVCDEAACHDPRLGSDLLTWRAGAGEGRLDPLEELACRLGRSAGTADHIAAAGALAARARGSFSSSLMGCREVQESLAGLVSGAGLVRLGACRLCRLLERGEREQAGRESAGLEDLARALLAETRTVARSLLGDPWAAIHLPADDPLSPDERITS